MLHWYAAAALVLLSLVAYANTFSGDFVLDSRVIVLEDPRIRELSTSNLELIANRSYWWPYKTADDLYRPVTTLSYLFNYAVLGNGPRPAGYHVVNILLHAVNVLLAYLVVFRVSRSLVGAAILAAVWAAHPLGTEAVTNIVGRADLLAASFVLSGAYAYLRAADSRGTARAGWLAAAVGAATLGVFSKESAVALVGIVVLYDLLVRLPRPAFPALVPAWLAMSLPLLVLLYQRSVVLEPLPSGTALMVDNPIVAAGFWQGLMTALAVLPRYVWLTVWPMRLSADYSYAQIPLATGTTAEWSAWISLVAMVAVCVMAGRRRPLVAFAAGTAFVALLPASNLLVTSGTIMGERLAYLPMLGILACLGIGMTLLLERVTAPPRLPLAIVAVIVIALVVRTWMRNADWESEVTIWGAAVAAAPASFKAHQGYADALYDADPTRSNLAEVVRHSHRSAEILSAVPDDQTVTRVFRLAAVYALEYADQVRASGKSPSAAGIAAMNEDGVRYAQRHVDVVIATRGGEQAIATDAEGARELADVYRLLSAAQSRLAAGEGALPSAERARALEPLNPLSYRTVAAAQVATSRYDDAAATFIAGFMVTGDASLRESVIELYRSGLDRNGCATTAGPTGPTLNPACEPVRRHLCLASREAVQTQRARGRHDLADNLQTAALQSFGCPATYFTTLP